MSFLFCAHVLFPIYINLSNSFFCIRILVRHLFGVCIGALQKSIDQCASVRYTILDIRFGRLSRNLRQTAFCSVTTGSRAFVYRNICFFTAGGNADILRHTPVCGYSRKNIQKASSPGKAVNVAAKRRMLRQLGSHVLLRRSEVVLILVGQKSYVVNIAKYIIPVFIDQKVFRPHVVMHKTQIVQIGERLRDIQSTVAYFRSVVV